MRACSVWSTITLPRKWRFCFFVFVLAMWRSLARLRFTLPVPVTLKRFLALEWVFIFGITKMISVKKWSAKVAPSPKVQKKSSKLFGKVAGHSPSFLFGAPPPVFFGVRMTFIRLPSMRGSCSAAPYSSNSFKKRSKSNSPRSLKTMARPLNWT